MERVLKEKEEKHCRKRTSWGGATRELQSEDSDIWSRGRGQANVLGRADREAGVLTATFTCFSVVPGVSRNQTVFTWRH